MGYTEAQQPKDINMETKNPPAPESLPTADLDQVVGGSKFTLGNKIPPTTQPTVPTPPGKTGGTNPL